MPGPYWCIRLTTRAWKTDYTACHPRKTTMYILRVVPITTHTQVNCKKRNKEKKRRQSKGKKRQDKEAEKRKKKRKEEKRQKKARKDKRRKQEKEKRRKNVTLADPRN